MATLNRHDRDWMRQTFLVSAEKMDDIEFERRTLREVDFGFTDTTLGGNFVINPPPQLTRTADVKAYGITAFGAKGFENKGMGRWYEEAIDSRSQRLYIRFGVPQFNSLLNFFANMYSPGMAIMARTGRVPGVMYEAGKMVGTVATLPAQPMIMVNRALNYMLGKPSSRFYSLNQAMPLYWDAVNTIVNGLATNMGIIPRAMTVEEQTRWADDRSTFTSDDMKAYYEVQPDIFHRWGGIDVYWIAGKAQRKANLFNEQLDRVMDSNYRGKGFKDDLPGKDTPFMARFGAAMKNIYGAYASPTNPKSYFLQDPKDGGAGVDAKWTAANAYLKAYADRADRAFAIKNADAVEQGSDKVGMENGQKAKWWDAMTSFFHGENQDGSQFLGLRVDYTGPTQLSISNEAGESEISQKINSIASANRAARTNLADGKLFGGVAGEAVGAVTQGASDFIAGAADKFGMAGAAALAGNAQIEIPKVWMSSRASLPRMDFSLTLRSAYGNKMARLLHLYVPLACILAGGSPLATGKQSYTSPFLCEAYCRGMMQSRLAMMDNINVTHGAGNIGFTEDFEPLQLDVSFSMVDLSTVFFMPIAPQGSWEATAAVAAGQMAATTPVGNTIGNAVGGLTGTDNAGEALGQLAVLGLGSTWDDENMLTDYLALLGGLSLQDQTSAGRRLKLAITRQMVAGKNWIAPSRIGVHAMGSKPGRLISILYRGSDRP